MDYTKWVADALQRNPALSQSGLARHLGRHRAVITMMLQGRRLIKADEMEQIAAYLGVPVPSKSVSVVSGIPFGGRIDRAWREDDGEAAPSGDVAPVLDKAWPVKDQSWYAVDAGTSCNTIMPGDVLIAHADQMAVRGRFLIVRRERAGMSNLAIAERTASKLTINGEPIPAKDRPEVVGTVIEIRRRAV